MKKYWLEMFLGIVAAIGVIACVVWYALPIVEAWWSGTVVPWWSAYWVLVTVVAVVGASAWTGHKCVPILWHGYKAVFLFREDILLLASVRTKVEEGHNIKFNNGRDGIQFELSNPYVAKASVKVQELQAAQEQKLLEGPSAALPNMVRYEDIRSHIPADHALVGVDGKGIITRSRAIKALTWIVGGSGSGKCLHEDEPVFLADGRVLSAKHLIGKSLEVVGVTDTKSMHQVPVLASFADNGVRTIVELELDNGVILKRTEEHPLWTAQVARHGGCRELGKDENGKRMREDNRRIRAVNAGWVQAKNIQATEKRYAGQVILCPTELHQEGTINRSDEEVVLCSVLLAEGGLTNRAVRFTSVSPEIVEAVTQAVAQYACEVVPIPMPSRGATINYRICSRVRNSGENRINTLAREWGIFGCSALNKRIPQWVFQLPDKQIALFLRSFIDCDGWFDAREGISQQAVNVGLANQTLVQQIGQLALRLGITGSYHYKANNHAGAWIWKSTEVDLWLEKVGSVVKSEKLAKAAHIKVAQNGKGKTIFNAWRTAQPSHDQQFAQCPKGYEWRKVVAVRTSIAPTVSIQVHNDNHAYVGYAVEHNTNTVCIRVDEDYEWGHRFLVIDPHWFKDDSMYNAIKGYADRFLMPVAYETEDILQVLDMFLTEFKRRKAGGSWEFPITILIDEVGSLTTDKPEDDQEKEMIDKIKQVARICGQESRGFEMTGMYISQDAAGLAWLRKRAIMVLAHQLLMMSERLLACNQNVEVARAMDEWPIGRTLVYGIGFKEGQRVVQQPVFQPKVVGADPMPSVSSVSSPLPDTETALEANPKVIEGVFAFPAELSLKKEKEAVEAGIRETIKRMKKRGMAGREIAPLVGLGGRKYSLYQQICQEENMQLEETEADV